MSGQFAAQSERGLAAYYTVSVAYERIPWLLIFPQSRGGAAGYAVM